MSTPIRHSPGPAGYYKPTPHPQAYLGYKAALRTHSTGHAKGRYQCAGHSINGRVAPSAVTATVAMLQRQPLVASTYALPANKIHISSC